MTDQDGRLVSVVVPAHNEESTVARFVERTAKAFAQLGRPWELLYVDDGSTDGTAAAVEAAARAEPRVRLVRQRRNLAHNEGWRIGEVKVPYEPRQAGRSKFGFSRLPVSFLDVVTLKFLLTFQRRPAIFFGALGSGMIGAGVLLWAYLLWSFLSSHTQYRPLMLVAGIAMLAGLLVILVGFLAELVVNVSERVERLERRLEDDAAR